MQRSIFYYEPFKELLALFYNFNCYLYYVHNYIHIGSIY